MANPFITQADPIQQTMVDPEAQSLQRQKQYAAMLLQNSQQPQGQMISGHYVAPSWTQQLSSAINPIVGAYMMNKADTEQAKLADQLRQQTLSDIQNYGQAMRGTPAGKPTYDYGNGEADQITTEVPGTPAVAPNPEKALGILMGSKSPQSQALAHALLAEQVKTHVLPEGGTLVRGGFGGGTGETIQGAPKQTTEERDYKTALAGGFKGSFFDYQQALKRAGANNISVSTGKDLASQVGNMAMESKNAAVGAVQQATAANDIIKAVDSNKLFTGPGASTKLTLAQIGSAIGAGGKDQNEKIGNTRQAIQGLAQLTLQGRKQMHGQGAITESEGALANRAISGDINFTPTEIRQLAEAAKRSAQFNYNQHQQIIGTMGQNPDTKNLVPYYSVPANTSIFEPTPIGGTSDVRSKADAILGGK